MIHKLYTFLILCLVSFLAACGGQEELSNPLVDTLTANDWELSSLLEKDVTEKDFGRQLPFVHFEAGGQVSGSTGCNTFRGAFQSKGNDLRIDPGAMTKMACAGDGEKNFLNALNDVSSAKAGVNELELLDSSGSVLMRLIPKK